MVYQDINQDFSDPNSSGHAPHKYAASVFDRFLSAVLDYFIFSPLVAFCILIFFKDSVIILKSAESILETQGLFLQVGIFSGLLFTLFQTLSIFMTGSTPGQKFLKLFIHFEHKPSSFFFQIWFRQIGFAFSILCLGLPFVAILYHIQHRTWYDRLTECDVVTFKHAIVDEAPSFVIAPSDKKYFVVSISIMMYFVFSALLLSLIQTNQMTVSRVQARLMGAVKIAAVSEKCDFRSEQAPAERIKKTLALNILSLVPDECVIEASDHFFSQLSHLLIYEDKQILQTTQSLAYFAKYYIAQKNGKNPEYLLKACSSEFQSELCSAVNERGIANVDSDDQKSSQLSQKILIILRPHK